jgi:citrate lyase subunit beta/citryl-CoA lyase
VTTAFRSVLFVPGVRPDRFASAIGSGADAVVLDLEDSVDASRKDEARHAVAAFLATQSTSGVARLVRVNSAGSRWWAQDLEWMGTLAACDGVVLPKSESASQVEELSRAAGGRPVIPLLETARGVLHAGAIAGARASIPAICFGAEDLTAEIGVPRTTAGEELLFARSQVVLAATTIGAEAVDAVFVDIKAMDQLRVDAERARALGFRGKMAIHPSQIGVINDVFSPSVIEIERARRLVDAYDAAAAAGEGVLRVDDRMVDAPVVARARRLLARAAQITKSPNYQI